MLDPNLFKDYEDLKIGDRVKFKSSTWGEGEGVVKHVWMGIEEMCDIRVDGDPNSHSFCRALGDKIEKLTEE